MTTDPTDPLEQIRAHLVLRIAQNDGAIEGARRQIAALATRPDVKPQAMLADLRPQERLITESSATRRALGEVLTVVDELAGRLS